MLKKPEWYYSQSAVIPYLTENSNKKILLITTKKKKKWTIPKGIVEPDLTPKESALQEAFEEAGIEGTIQNGIFDTFRYDKWGGTCHVEVFLMEITRMLDEWPEVDLRTRRKFHPEEAITIIGRKEMEPVLRKFGQSCKSPD